ncbi:1-deoxy-D-xylulose-5-phosphate reductoisomerase [Reinekea sp.]|jgi:1-deoxy-D-xylulose-5-phosphate reductoisomerase|uniref:1-deoxy-D-xylulose-5-phosphate reductoisomerase n=1 Tax=Reinekea sp. TaxID=1970455 RepID=UPI0039891D3A
MNEKPLNITLLGATGSIGCSTLDVIKRHPDKFRVFALSGFQNTTLLAQQISEFQPKYAVVPDQKTRKSLLSLISASSTDVLVGTQALIEIAQAPEVDAVMAAIVGSAGLESSLAAAKAGKKLLLANKESLVVAGALLMDAVRDNQALLLPIDSEHNAIFQCMPHDGDSGVESILLTASGGPFRDFSLEQLAVVTPEQAVAHPNWSMGQKISVDSASLMNKGLELIEACWLFNVHPDQIEVVIHPQSVIHSMVRYVDGSVISQMGAPDMRTPIAYGLAYPERIDSGSPRLEFSSQLNLSFDQPDRKRFPCLRLAEEAMDIGGIQPAVLNAANEITVAAFLDRHLSFMDIAEINERVFNAFAAEPVESLEQLIEIDQRARVVARDFIAVKARQL